MTYIAVTPTSLSMQTKTSTAYLSPTTYLPLPPTYKTTNKQKAQFARCRDGVKVLWCRSYLVWLVPSLHVLVLIQKTFLWLVIYECIAVFKSAVVKQRGHFLASGMVSYHHDWRETWHFIALTIQWTLVALMKFLKVKNPREMCSLSVQYCWWDIFTYSYIFASLYL